MHWLIEITAVHIIYNVNGDTSKSSLQYTLVGIRKETCVVPWISIFLHIKSLFSARAFYGIETILWYQNARRKH